MTRQGFLAGPFPVPLPQRLLTQDTEKGRKRAAGFLKPKVLLRPYFFRDVKLLSSSLSAKQA